MLSDETDSIFNLYWLDNISIKICLVLMYDRIKTKSCTHFCISQFHVFLKANKKSTKYLFQLGWDSVGTHVGHQQDSLIHISLLPVVWLKNLPMCIFFGSQKQRIYHILQLKTSGTRGWWWWYGMDTMILYCNKRMKFPLQSTGHNTCQWTQCFDPIFLY